MSWPNCHSSFLDKWEVMLSLFWKLVIYKTLQKNRSFTSDFHSRRSKDWTNSVARLTTWCSVARIAPGIRPAASLCLFSQTCFSDNISSHWVNVSTTKTLYFRCEQLYYCCAGHAIFVHITLEYLTHSGPDQT